MFKVGDRIRLIDELNAGIYGPSKTGVITDFCLCLYSIHFDTPSLLDGKLLRTGTKVTEDEMKLISSKPIDLSGIPFTMLEINDWVP